jgi:hypothetical protein
LFFSFFCRGLFAVFGVCEMFITYLWHLPPPLHAYGSLPIGGISPCCSGGQPGGEVKVSPDCMSSSKTSIPPVTIPAKKHVDPPSITRAQYNRG